MQREASVSAPALLLERPRFSVGRALSRTLGVCSAELPLFLGVALLVHSPGFLVWVATWSLGGALGLWTQQLQAFLDLAMSFIATGLAGGLSRLSPLVSTAIGTTLHIAAQYLLLIVPGIIATVRWAVVGPVCAVDPDADVRDRCAALTSGHGWELFGILVALNVAQVVVNAGFRALIGMTGFSP